MSLRTEGNANYPPKLYGQNSKVVIDVLAITPVTDTTAQVRFTKTWVSYAEGVPDRIGKFTATVNPLSGLTANDKILGGGGKDRIGGGCGMDQLLGDAGRNLLVFEAPTDMGKNASADRIMDFTHGADRIDLSGIMPDARFNGSAGFHDRAGEVCYVRDTGRLT